MKEQYQYKLTVPQLQVVGLLSVGTFLEYFDLMLYIHMAVLLNDLFFPKSDSSTAMLLSAFSFCSTFVFRPLGSLLFGWVGDNIGRKAVVVITTFMMSLSCVIMANLPTYSQVGITAAWAVTLCRILQGISSSGEIVGARLYLTETTQPPIQYFVVALITVASTLGTLTALGLASLFTSYLFNWRMAFWFGCIIAIVGSIARTSLKETKDFADAKRRATNLFNKAGGDLNALKVDPFVNEKVNIKTSVYFFLVNCCWPICMYFSYIHCGDILKISFNYTSEQVIRQNFILSIVALGWDIFFSLLSYKIYPLKILKLNSILFFAFVLACPFLLNIATNNWMIFIVQSGVIGLTIGSFPADPIFFKNFPVFKRFTYTSMLYALARAVMYVVTSFGIVYLTRYFGHWGIVILLIPVIIGCYFSYLYFEKLEKERQKRLI